MFKLSLFLNSLIITLLVIGCLPVMATSSNIEFQSELTVQEASELEKEAFNDIIQSFALYSSFFNDNEQIGSFYVPIHASNRLTAINYLTEGFSEELAHNIIDTYTMWNQDINKQIIIPCEGIPVLTEEDISRTTYSYINNNTIIFQCCFSNCYLPGDIYLYQITAIYKDTKWKIDNLQFDAVYEPDTSQFLQSD